MDQFAEKLGDAVPPILLYSAYMAGVPLRPRILPPHTAQRILPASILERPESSLDIHRLLE